MTREQWEQVEHLLEDAAARPVDERDAFLQDACDDAAVREEVRSLLCISDDATGFFDRLAGAVPSGPAEGLERGASAAAANDPLDLEGTRIDRYAVAEHLGGGGMGVVYRARDTQLDRSVALKFLPPYLATSAEAEKRFLREAQAAAALDHPHIATVYEIGETDDGHRFIAMAYYPGETLKEKMAREGPLPVDEAVEYAAQIAEGLARAHEAGILHRDVKPANVMVTEESQVKLVDFGLARAAGQSRLTEPGRRLGTAAYMSPEQARGTDVDARTDLWALGVVLYEMLTGERPFERERETAVLQAILHEEPDPPSTTRPEISQELERILRTALQKDPEDRFESADDMLHSLEQTTEARRSAAPLRRPGTTPLAKWGRWAMAGLIALAVALATLWAFIPNQDVLLEPLGFTSATGSEGAGLGAAQTRQGLVVLPCPDEAADPSLCTGLMATLTDPLTRMQNRLGVWVVPTDHVQRSGVTTPKDARKLYNPDLIVTGTAERSEETVRIQLSLLDGAQLETRNTAEVIVPAANLTTVQSELVAGVVGMLDAERPENSIAIETGTDLPGAYDAYLRGRGHLWHHETADRLDAALDALRRSVRMDTVYARAHTALCDGYRHRYVATTDTQWVAMADRHCTRALALNDQLVGAHKARGLLLRETRQYEKAARALRRAQELHPDRADLYRFLASVYEQQGQFKKAEETYDTMTYRWPDYWVGYAGLGRFFFRRGRYQAAAGEFRSAVHRASQNFELYNWLAGSHVYAGDLTRARTLFEDLIEKYPNYGAYSNLGTIYFEDARYADAARMFEKALDRQSDDYRLWGNLAAAHYWAGAREKARRYYRRAVQMAEERRATSPQNPVLLSHMAGYYAMLDERDRALSLIEKAANAAPKNRIVAFMAGSVYEQLGQRDAALEWIEKALDFGYPLARIKRKRGLRELRADPRFEDIAGRETTSS